MKKYHVFFIVLVVVLIILSLGQNAIFAQTVDQSQAEVTTEEPVTQAAYRYAFPLIFYKSKPGQQPPDPIGPVGGTFTSVMTDPNNPNIVYGGHFLRGVFKSYDQGQTWNEKNKGLPTKQIQSLAIHPRHSNILYAGTYGKGVYLSRDGGDNWIPWNGGKLDNHIVYDIEIDRLNPSNVYAASRVNGSLLGFLFRSTDAGSTWTVVYRGDWFDTLDYFYDVAVHPAGINTVYLAAHEHGFLKSTDNGKTFTLINNGVTDLSARGFAFTKANQNQVMAAVWKGSGTFRTYNAGAAWQQVNGGLPGAVRIGKIKGDPFSLSTNRFFVATYGNGVYNTANFGDSWVYRGLSGYQVNDIAISYSEPQTWFLATQDKGMLRTKNGGSSWATINDDLRLYTVTGMQMLEDERVFVAVYGQGVFQVKFEEDEWLPINEGLDDLAVTGFYSDGKKLWVTNDYGLWQYKDDLWQSTGLPTTKVSPVKHFDWQNDLLGIPQESLIQTLEMKGKQSINSGIARSISVTSLAFDGSKLFVGSDDGVWKFSGQAWKQIGLEGQLVHALAIDSLSNRLFGAICADSSQCQLWRLDKNGWQAISQGLNGSKVHDIKPIGGDVFVATSQGIYKWHEETQRWVAVLEDTQDFLSLQQKPGFPSTLIASGHGVVYVSQDFGETWRELTAGGDWHYQHIGFIPGDDVKILLGSKESGAFLMAIED